jgi:quercetin dioxygenase-like cupin family protein
MSGNYTVIHREDADDVMAGSGYPGQMRMMTGALENEQIAITWRHMPPGAGGKGSYGHFHKTQEEILYVLSGRVQAKLDDEVVELGPGHAVRIAPQCVRSVHNDGPEDAEILLISKRIDDVRADVETVPDFWPE